jgi:hypothetical protein
MSVFHRLTVPSYFGGLPAGYDYINNAISGTPANADVQKASGPNIGTYFIAFGEDATSSDANRPNLALSTNTDYLDNLMRSDLVDIVRTTDSTVSGSPQTSITLTGTGTIWLGSGGYAFQDLFHIVDVNERDIEVSGTKVVVSGISSGGTLGGGFATSNVTLTLNVGIPVGTTFHMYFCERTNLATLPIDAMTLPFMRNQTSVDGSVVDFVAQISNPHTLGNAVAGVQAYRFQGPDGIRLAKNATMFFDCDPADSGATVRQFEWTTRQASVDRLVAALYDDPTSTLFTGLTGMLQVDAGVGYSSLGTLTFQDVNLSTAGSSLNKTWGLTSSTSAYGDQFPRIFDVPVTFNMIGAQVPSLLNYINGRWETTCGDGTVSFGDFSGPQSIQNAITYAQSAGVAMTQLNIKLKRGTYNFTTFIDLPGAGDTVIEGVDAGQTILQGNVSSILQNGMFNLTNGRLWLKNLTMTFVSGQQWAIIGAAGSSLFMENVNIVNLGIEMTNPETYNGLAAIYCRNCRFAPSTSGVVQWFIILDDHDAVAHNGFYFTDCTWFCSDETTPMRVLGAPGGGVTQMQRVSFLRCNYTLGGTATTSSHLTNNTGVLEVNPGGGNGVLWVVDVEWVDCFVTSVSTASNSPVARIYSVALGDNVGTNLAVIGRVTIRGGRWTCNQTHATAISPVLIAAQEVVIDDVIFISNALTSGGPSSEDTNMLDGITHSVADWAQFIFAPGAQTVSALSNDIRLGMRAVSFRGMRSASDSGDLWLYLGTATSVDGLVLTDYVSGGGGSAPSSRMRVTPPGTFPNPNNSLGSIKNVVLAAAALGSGQYTTGVAGNSGVLMLMPTYQSAANPCMTFVIDNVAISGFYGAAADDCINLPNASSFTSVGWAYTLIDCQCAGPGTGIGGTGISLYGHGTSGQGGNFMALDNFRIIRGVFYNLQNGIILNPDYFGSATIDGVTCRGNSIYGLSVSPNSWQHASRIQSLVCVNSQFFDNLGGNGQCYFQTNTGGDLPYIVFKGNTLMLDGALDYARFNVNGGSALASTYDVGANFWILGIETTISGGGTNTMGFANNGNLIENIGKLKTP